MRKIFLLGFIIILFVLPLYSFGLASCPDKYGLCDSAQEGGFMEGDASVFIGNIIKAVLSILGVLILIFILYGGYLWLASGGNEQMVKKAKDILTNAAIGLIIVLAAYAITTFVVRGITGAISSNADSSSTSCSDGFTRQCMHDVYNTACQEGSQDCSCYCLP